MNKTLTINLSGMNFYIDVNAYSQLEQYLHAVSDSLDPESRKETMQDIEARIAELFLEDLQNSKKVITQSMVDKIMNIMGQPEDYQVDDEQQTHTEKEPQHANPTSTQKMPKKLYRDIDSRAIGGVCTGLGYYMGIDRVWIRLIFLLLLIPIFVPRFILPTGSTIFLLYIILWIVIPAARTTSQKLEMQGEKIDIDNIEKYVRDEHQNKRAKATSIAKDEGLNGNSKAAPSKILKVFLIVLGSIIILIAGVSLLAFIFNLFRVGIHSALTIIPFPWMVPGTVGLPAWMIFLCWVVIVGIPLLLLIFLGIKLIKKDSHVITTPQIFVLIGIWLIAFIPLISGSIFHSPKKGINLFTKNRVKFTYSTNYSYKKTTRTIKLNDPDTLIISSPTPLKRNKIIRDILQKSESQVAITQKSHGNETPKYSLDYLSNDTLWINESISHHNNTSKLNATLFLKDSTIFKVEKNAEKVFNTLPSHYAGHYLQMRDHHIHCTDCNVPDDTSSEEDLWYQDPTSI